MRHLSYILCASIAACGYATLASAITNPPLAFTLDLLAPCTLSGCGSSIHPTDISLQVSANSFTYAQDTSVAGSPFVATLAVTAPVICDEVAASGLLGATSAFRVAPIFSNSAPGGLLEFNAGGASIVDLTAITYDGATPSGVAATYSNASAKPQVVCYHINPVSGGPAAYASGPYGIFKSSFEDHPSGEPWLSVQTVSSPNATAGRAAQTSSPTPTNTMGYVVQLHNAAAAIGWHLDLGYDYAFFDPASNGGVSAQWCILGSNIPQPGTLSGTATCNTVSSTHTIAAGDIQAATNSVYIYVENRGSTAASSNWSSLTSSLYPAVAAIFPPFGTYPQRFDDKVAVASANNRPTLNIGSIVCTNQTTPVCTLTTPDGNAVTVNYTNSVTNTGIATIDPLAYFVDPNGGTTLPGNVAADVLTVSNVSCVDPQVILASPIAGGNFTTSPSTQGGKRLGFGFKPSGSLYVAGTARCTATFTTSGNANLPLSTTSSFTIRMQ